MTTIGPMPKNANIADIEYLTRQIKKNARTRTYFTNYYSDKFAFENRKLRDCQKKINELNEKTETEKILNYKAKLLELEISKLCLNSNRSSESVYVKKIGPDPWDDKKNIIIDDCFVSRSAIRPTWITWKGNLVKLTQGMNDKLVAKVRPKTKKFPIEDSEDDSEEWEDDTSAFDDEIEDPYKYPVKTSVEDIQKELNFAQGDDDDLTDDATRNNSPTSTASYSTRSSRHSSIASSLGTESNRSYKKQKYVLHVDKPFIYVNVKEMTLNDISHSFDSEDHLYTRQCDFNQTISIENPIHYYELFEFEDFKKIMDFFHENVGNIYYLRTIMYDILFNILWLQDQELVRVLNKFRPIMNWLWKHSFDRSYMIKNTECLIRHILNVGACYTNISTKSFIKAPDDWSFEKVDQMNKKLAVPSESLSEGFYLMKH